LVGLRGGVAGAGCVLVGAHRRAINADDAPFQGSRRVGLPLHGLEHALPDAQTAKAHQPVVAGLPRAVALGQIAPGGAGAQHPEDAVENLAMILVLAAALSLRGGQQRCQAFPFLIGKVGACHSTQIVSV
jgi:hypothetical protein